MKTSNQYLERHNWQLRLQDTAEANTQPASPIAFLKALWQGFTKTMIGGNELRVWQTSDIDGYLHWRAHDPVTGETTIRDSEDEMRIWIEQRHHNHPDASAQRYQQQYYQLLPLR